MQKHITVARRITPQRLRPRLAGHRRCSDGGVLAVHSQLLRPANGARAIRPRPQSPTDLGDRISISEQEKLEKIILPTQFQALKDFHAYLKIANYGVTTMKTPRKFLPTITDEFLPRDFDLQQLLKEAPAVPPRPSLPRFRSSPLIGSDLRQFLFVPLTCSLASGAGTKIIFT